MTDFDSFKEGDILVATFVWDDTHIPHFYKVLKKTPTSLKIVQMKSKVLSGRGQWGEVIPTEISKEEKPRFVRKASNGTVSVKLNTWGNYLSKWSGSSVHQSFM